MSIEERRTLTEPIEVMEDVKKFKRERERERVKNTKIYMYIYIYIYTWNGRLKTREVQGDQLAAWECYLAMLAMDEQMPTMSIEERRMLTEPIEVMEDVLLDKSNLEKFTRIGTSMEEKTKQDLVQFLQKSTDVFAWSHEDMPGIDPSVITHRLNVSPSYKPIHQKKKMFAPEQDNAIKEEVHNLVTTEFIREVYYPDWLANVVVVKKANS